ncbi:unnamed protein product [Aphanomyces euteiches]
MPDVLAALNVKLKKDINATLEVNYIGWGDVASKYPLILAAGENVDIVYAADWNMYGQQALKGAFYEVTPEILKQYMPHYNAKQDPAAYKAAQVEGKQYMIPTLTPDRKVGVMILRKDIMAKAGLTSVTKMSELEPYFAEIKKSYPDMIPLNLDSNYEIGAPFGWLADEKMPFTWSLETGIGVASPWSDPSGKVYNMVTDEPYLSSMKYAAGKMKEWYAAGYVNKNPYANKTRSKENICEGKSGVAFGNTIDIAATMTACKAKGIDTYIVSDLSPEGFGQANNWTNNGVAIAANSKNPERAMQALDLIIEDESYVDLIYYGIEGKNYAVTADNKLKLPDGVTAETNTYPPDAAGFWFVDKNYFKVDASWTDDYVAHYNKVKDLLKPGTLLGFNFNIDKVKSEIANMKTVSTQYGNPIYVGQIKDVDSAFKTLADKLKSAGIDKVKAEYESQSAAFLANKAK